MKLNAEKNVIEHVKKLVLSGTLKPGAKLLSEREISILLSISRPIVHKAMLKLEKIGLIEIVPRKGIYIRDFREKGTLSMLDSIYDLYREGIDRRMNESLIIFAKSNIKDMLEIILNFESSRKADFLLDSEFEIENDIIFKWLHFISIKTDNLVYPLLINELKTGIINITKSVLESDSPEVLIHYINKINYVLMNGSYSRLETEIDDMFKYMTNEWLNIK
jgi:DNA-binding FadR family transcriptional regulator